MKKNKKIKLALKKQTIVKLDEENLKGIKGGQAQFLSIFHCCTDNSRSCTGGSPTALCNPNDTIIIANPN